MLSRHALAELFDTHFPVELLKGIVVAIVDGYKENVGNLRDQEIDKCDSDWLSPLNRRALLETRIRSVTKQFAGEGVKTEIRSYSNGMTFTTLSAGPFLISVSMLPDDKILPTAADFRTEQSLVNHSLFAEYESPENRFAYFGILCHTPLRGTNMPQAIKVLFPDQHYSSVMYKIDLLERYGWVTESEELDQEVAEMPELTLRQSVQEEIG